jgi:hypothetical protein
MLKHVYLALVLVASLAPSVRADFVGQTTLVLESPAILDVDTVDSVVIDWSTGQMSGQIDVNDITNLTFTLRNGASTVYQDVAVISGVVQPIRGVGRVLGDLAFNFDIDTLMLNPVISGYFNNDNVTKQISGSGISYLIKGDSSGITGDAIFLSRFKDDNDFADMTLGIPFTQSTLAVPEPSAFLYGGLITVLAGCGYRIKRRLA